MLRRAEWFTLYPVLIVVCLSAVDPIEGIVLNGDGAAPTSFYGWLGLIRTMADAVEETETSPPPADGSEDEVP